jgi:hypothetical protein
MTLMGFRHFSGYMLFPVLRSAFILDFVYLKVNPAEMLAQGTSKLTSYLQLTPHHSRSVETMPHNFCSI